MWKWILLALVVAYGVAALIWPGINDVETGKTPQYSELQPKAYAASEAKVAEAARRAIASLPRWEVVGSGAGRGGSEIQAIATTRLLRFKDDVTVRVRAEGGKTTVSVRSKSRVGRRDFGQNARNIRAFLEALDRELSH